MHLHPDSLKVTVYIENKQHVHNKRPYFIPTKTKDKVIEMYSDGILPKEIAQYLRDNIESGYFELTTKTINNITQYTKTSKGKITLLEAQEWCDQKKSIPEDDDEVFTSEFDFSNDSREDNRYFHLFATTKRLLSFALKCELLATDATYKLNYQGYPVLLCGTVDKAKQFHPFGLLLSKTEQQRDFEYLFKTIQSLIK